jgi:hypothetical protein
MWRYKALNSWCKICVSSFSQQNKLLKLIKRCQVLQIDFYVFLIISLVQIIIYNESKIRWHNEANYVKKINIPGV